MKRFLASLGVASLLAGTAAAQAPLRSPIRTRGPARRPAAPAPAVLHLTLAEAVRRGLQHNLAVLLSAEESRRARARRLEALAGLLPHVSASAGELRQRLSLAAMGISFPGVPPLIGPFNVFDARGAATMNVVNLSAWQRFRAAGEGQAAAGDAFQAARNLVVLAVTNQYLRTRADSSQVAARRAELQTADTQWRQAQDMLHAGTVDALTVVRAEVERNQEEQRLIAAQAALDKQRLALAHAIGLSLEQAFQLAPGAAAPAPALTPAAAVSEALAQRPDYAAAEASVRAGELGLAAARDARLPALSADGNWGTIGHEIGSNHPTFEVGLRLSLPVFEGGMLRAGVLTAQAQLREAEERAADLRAAIDEQVRDALFDLDTSRQQLSVARQARALARRELTMANDRFRAGVADNLDVVRAEQALAQANDGYIDADYAFGLANAALEQALGVRQ